MNNHQSVGFFGKLPAHGDFIYRSLPGKFINVWDSWLQGFVKCSQEQLGEPWLDIYLTSPIWRFAFSEGVIDENSWMGILLPSVDRVGRYFPFSIAARLPGAQIPFELINQTAWYETIESLALGALEGRVAIDDLIQDINASVPGQTQYYQPGTSAEFSKAAVVAMDFETRQPITAAAPLLDDLLRQGGSSYGVWATLGSDLVEPCLFYSKGLPALQNLASMLDGQWAARGWSQPCRLTSV